MVARTYFFIGIFIVSGSLVFSNFSISLASFKTASVPLTWNIQAVKADQFWSVMNYRGENIKVAIIDSGVNYTLPDLDGNYLGGHNFVDNNDYPMDYYGHGTACAAIAVGEGHHSYTGVAPGEVFCLEGLQLP